MKKLVQGALLSLALISTAGVSLAQQAPLRPNQTLGYAGGKLFTFTYTQNFACVEQPNNDLNFNGRLADRDGSETRSPICQAGASPTINPPGNIGNARATTDPIYVLVPMFSVDNDKNPNDAISCVGVVPGTLCGPQLGSTLISLFGALPEAFKAHPLVYSQCPDKNKIPGHCTMHAAQIDLAPVLAQLGYIPNPPTANVFVPSPNHSHVLARMDANIAAEWWQVLPILVLDQADWPNQAGTTGITSVAKINAAEKAHKAVYAPSNFFLYFSSRPMSVGMKMDH